VTLNLPVSLSLLPKPRTLGAVGNPVNGYKAFMLFDADFYPWWCYRFTTVGGMEPGQRWEGCCMAKFNRTPPEPVTLRPGESRVVKAMLDSFAKTSADFACM
jgi:hypothetical protein